MIFQQVDRQRIPDMASGDPIRDLPVILIINNLEAVRIYPAIAPAGKTVEKSRWYHLKQLFHLFKHAVVACPPCVVPAFGTNNA